MDELEQSQQNLERQELLANALSNASSNARGRWLNTYGNLLKAGASPIDDNGNIANLNAMAAQIRAQNRQQSSTPEQSSQPQIGAWSLPTMQHSWLSPFAHLGSHGSSPSLTQLMQMGGMQTTDDGLNIWNPMAGAQATMEYMGLPWPSYIPQLSYEG